MSFDLGTLIRAAAMGGGAYQQAQRDQEDRTRRQQREDEQIERQKKADARAAAAEERESAEWILRQEALKIANRKNAAPPPVPPKYRASVDGISGDFMTPEEAIAFRARVAQPERDERTPAEIEMDELRRRELAARVAAAERENTVQTTDVPPDMRLDAGVLLGTVGATRPDPNNIMNDLDMRALVERNTLIRTLINDHGLSRSEAEREARRRLGPG